MASPVKASFDDLLEAIKFEHGCMADECIRLKNELAKACATATRRGEDSKNSEDTDNVRAPGTSVEFAESDSDAGCEPMFPRKFQQVRMTPPDPEVPSGPMSRGNTSDDTASQRNVSRMVSTRSNALSAVDSIYNLKQYEEEMRRLRNATVANKSGFFTEISKATVSQMTSVQKKLMKHKTRLEDLERMERKGLGSFVRAEFFSLLSAFLTLSNALYIGIETNAQVQAEMEWYFDRAIKEEPDFSAWTAGNLVFVILFLLELLVRIVADGSFFFFGRDRMWNYFDTVVVTTATVEVILEYADVRVGLGISLLRTLKIVRILRLMRLQRDEHASVFSRFIRNLKTMLSSIGGSATSFVSSMLLLVFFVYIFGLMFMQGLPQYLHQDESEEEIAFKLQKYYGTLDKTLWSLIGSVTGGYDWTLVADPLKEIGIAYVLFFVMYIAFVLLGLLNILNGTFVHASVQAAENNRERAIERMIGQRQTMMRDMINMFIEADVDKSGTISWSEFETYMEDDRVRAYFEALGLDTSDIWKIFNVLDVKKEGELGLAEFVEGCFRLRGPAKVVDLLSIQDASTEMLNRISFVGAHLRKVDNRIRIEMVDLLKMQDSINSSMRVSQTSASSSIRQISRPGTPSVPKVMMIERSMGSAMKNMEHRVDAAEIGQAMTAESTRIETSDMRRVDSGDLRNLDSFHVSTRPDASKYGLPAEEYRSIAESILAKVNSTQAETTQDKVPGPWKPWGILPPRGPSAPPLDSILSKPCTSKMEPNQPPWIALSSPLGQTRT